MVKTSEGHGLGMFIWAGEPGDGTDTSADLWKEPPRYRRCSPSHTNTIWLPLTRRRRPHTCTTQPNTWRLHEAVLNQNSHPYLSYSDAAKFKKKHLLKLCFAVFFSFDPLNQNFHFVTFFFLLVHWWIVWKTTFLRSILCRWSSP